MHLRWVECLVYSAAQRQPGIRLSNVACIIQLLMERVLV